MQKQWKNNSFLKLKTQKSCGGILLLGNPYRYVYIQALIFLSSTLF